LKQNTIGKKIRELRLQKGMTQAALAGDTVTRNMLSQIENGVAQPSVTTIVEIAERLEVPTEYFFSDCEDLNVFRKIGMIDGVRRAFAAKDYGRCIYRLDRLAVSDEETEYLYAESCFALGVAAYREGKLRLAEGHFERSLAHAEKTHYVGESFLCAVNRYLAAIRFVCDKEGFPRAELPDEIRECLADFHYVSALCGNACECVSEDSLYGRHLALRARMETDEPCGLIAEMKEILAGLDEKRYAVLRYYVLSDIESLAQRAGDFKCAYECASERLAIAEVMRN
jgi:transcriptional regulator with XRE-family HTH domain